MSRRVIHWVDTAMPNVGNRWWDMLGGVRNGNVEENNSSIALAAGVIENLVIDVETAFGGSDGWTFTVYVNSVATAMTFSITGAATTGRYTATSIAVAEGDRVALKVAAVGFPSTFVAWRTTFEFNSTTTDQTFYSGYIGSGGGSDGNLRYINPFAPSAPDTVATSVRGYVAAPGTISKMSAMQHDTTTAPAGSGYYFVIYKNGVRQDGTAGTVDTKLSFLAFVQNTLQSKTFSLSVVRGDYLEVEMETELAGGAMGFFLGISLGIKWTSTNTGQFPMSQAAPGTAGTVTNWRGMHSNYANAAASAWVTANNFYSKNTAPISGMTVHSPLVYISSPPGAGTSHVFRIQQNDTTVANSPAATIADAALSGEDTTHTLTLVDTDTFRFHHTAVSSPLSTSTLYYSWIQGGTATPPPVPRSYGYIL